jgi:hypothetical protein
MGNVLPNPEIPNARGSLDIRLAAVCALFTNRAASNRSIRTYSPEGVMSDLIVEEKEGTEIDPLAVVLGGDTGRGAVVEVAQLWGDAWLGTRRFPKAGRAVTIGSADDGADFLVPGVPARELVAWIADRPVVRVDPGWDGFVDTGGRRLKLAEAAERDGVVVEGDRRVVVELGGMVFVVQRVAPGKRAAAALGEGFDWMFASIATGVGMAGVLFGALLQFLPPLPESTMYEDPEPYLDAFVFQPPPEKAAAAPSGEKHKGEEGKVGEESAKQKVAKGSKKKAPSDLDVVKDSGALGALQDEGLAAVLDGGLSPSLMDGVGGLIGVKGTQIGSAGFGSRGTGIGGGGKADDLGGLGLVGKGPGAGGSCKECGGIGVKSDAVLPDTREAVLIGGYDKSLVDDVVKKHLNSIRYCYQRELQKDADLGGKVVVRFTIAKDGSVSQASTKSSSLGNDAVTSCIEQRFFQMSFPAPKAGIVIVSYPFLFGS